MKKGIFKKAAGILLAGTLLAASFCGCGKNNGENEEATTKAAQVTVTFMNGETKLGSVSVESGSSVAETEYGKYEKADDAEFLGWFETPTFLAASKKEPSKTSFTKDTTLYGSFKSTVVNNDTRVWYIAGTSEKGALKDCNWANKKVEEALREQFVLQATGKNPNEFAITIDLYAGDQFQIIHDWAWDGQKGFGTFTEIDETLFESGGAIGGTDNKANVNVLQDGNYTITLTTNPDDEAFDTLTIVRNGDIK